MGGLGLVFLIDPNIYNGFKMKGCLEWVFIKSKIFGYMLRVLLSMTAVLMVLSPAIGGIFFSTVMRNPITTTTTIMSTTTTTTPIPWHGGKGFLITGGDETGTVEIFSPGKTTSHCKIDPLPEERNYHISAGNHLWRCWLYQSGGILHLLE